jgi:alpha-ketoglutarate-dependent taurine dioxygenase
LFRGFGLDSLAEFKKIATALSSELLDYTYRSTPRTEISDKIYTSTEYPADQSIPLHNENAYSSSWPMKILFFSMQTAKEGGETPIADSRKIFRLLDSQIRDEFIHKKVMYVRNYGAGLDLPWEEVFQTTDKGAVEQFCRQSAIDFEWMPHNRLRTRQVCQSVATHPWTGDVVWFNQAHLFHVAALEPRLRESLLATLDESELPRNVYFGDGTPIGPDVIVEIQRVYNDAAVSFRWQDGDVLLVDNMLVAHGRKPYSGPRKVLVAMADHFQSNGAGH